MYSYSTVSKLKVPELPNNEIVAKVIGYDLFGDDENVLVVKISDPLLMRIHNNFVADGAIHAQPTFTPHITIQYNVDKSITEKKIKELIVALPKIILSEFEFDDVEKKDV